MNSLKQAFAKYQVVVMEQKEVEAKEEEEEMPIDQTVVLRQSSRATF
jgi:hypothetical protein